MKIFTLQNLYKVLDFGFRLWCLSQILTGSDGSSPPTTQERINNLKKYQAWLDMGGDKDDFKPEF